MQTAFLFTLIVKATIAMVAAWTCVRLLPRAAAAVRSGVWASALTVTFSRYRSGASGAMVGRGGATSMRGPDASGMSVACRSPEVASVTRSGGDNRAGAGSLRTSGRASGRGARHAI